MDPSPAGVRLFLALDLPTAAREAIGRWRDALVAERPELRPVADESLHVTLVFLGRRPGEVVERVWRAAAGALAELDAPTLRPAGIEAVPPRRSRVVALDLEDEGGRAGTVQGALGAALATEGLYEVEPRPFWPHVTVARVRTRARLRGDAWPPLPAQIAAFTASRVTLYRSDLHRAGARYRALERLELRAV